ncbi:MAG: ABC transporter ATP-binding protein [Deltaproteobacteria bacterium]|nr:ABC transporter ATP-binding protein [Deltaproteobacteria bacterium]
MPASPDQTSNGVVIAKSVCKKFKAGKRVVTAADNVSFILAQGKVTGLIGPDGAGKTTLLRLMAGLFLPDSGSLNVLGVDVTKNPLRVQESIGYMPQRFGLYEDLTVQENLDLYADLQGVPKRARKSRYDVLMRMTGLGPFTMRFAGALSGGMKQKLGLACTLVRPPSLLLLDEPTVGVDPVSRRELWGIVYRLVEKEGLTVLLSTAYLDEAERCDHVFLMHQGRFLGKGPPDSFSKRVLGRSFQVSTPEMTKRKLQEKLSRTPGVVDAIIQGEKVRVVTNEAPILLGEKLFPDIPGRCVAPVPPRFEDCFIDMLKKEDGHTAQRGINTGMTAHLADSNREMIRVDRVTRRFGNFYAVKEISFKVRHGEIFGLLGANGAGKSTTFRMLCGLLPPSGGKLNVAGRDLRHAAAKARSRIGYMAQKFSLYGDLSVMENLKFFSSAYGLYGKRQKERIDWALNELELFQYANAMSGNLPLGFKQRLALAVALMHGPDIIFLDEPTSGVDPLARREFWHRINSLAEQGVTVLVTTHFMEEAEYCDRLVLMAEGEIIARGTPFEMKERFRSEKNPEPSMEDVFIGMIEA